jgi:mono/diheme cytochrome c family protein
MERRPWKRPIAVGTYTFIFLALFGLGWMSYRSDHNDLGYAAQLVTQQKETEEFMRKPFELEVAQPAPSAVPATAADPLVAQGAQIYQKQSCNACHGDAGVGTAAGPKLTGIRQRMSADQLASLLKAPSAKMIAGGMAPLSLPPDAMKSLVAYLEGL